MRKRTSVKNVSSFYSYLPKHLKIKNMSAFWKLALYVAFIFHETAMIRTNWGQTDAKCSISYVEITQYFNVFTIITGHYAASVASRYT